MMKVIDQDEPNYLLRGADLFGCDAPNLHISL